VISLEDLEQLTTPIDIVINGTSTGLSNTSVITDEIAQKLTLLNSTKPQFAYDMVYGKQTTFLKQFTQLGFQTQDGLGMLVEQAAVSFELWRGLPASSLDTQLVKTALRT
jgi:shikimate dehydrogenase